MKTTIYIILVLGLYLLTACKPEPEAVFSEWRGAGRTGIYNETNLLEKWPDGGPELLWSIADLPAGYSSVAVAGDKVFLTGTRDSSDYLLAFNSMGEKLWETAVGRAWDGSYVEARCTPTVEGEKIYASSGKGDLACIDALSGKKIWSIEANDEFGGGSGKFGISESLLLVGNKLIYTPGGESTTIIALNKDNGSVIWKSESISDLPAYVSPLLVEKDSNAIIFQVLQNYVIGVDAKNGKLICKDKYTDIVDTNKTESFNGAFKINTNTPVYSEGYLYITSGYNHVGVKYKVADDFSALTTEWIDTTLDVHHGGVVLLDGFLYGANWLNNKTGNWCCVDWATGKTRYETEWECKGSIIAANGYLYIYDEKDGNIGLAKATPDGLTIISSFTVPMGTGPHWAHPVINNGKLYIRHMDALMVYDISKKTNA